MMRVVVHLEVRTPADSVERGGMHSVTVAIAIGVIRLDDGVESGVAV
jgi:hypothetical protein